MMPVVCAVVLTVAAVSSERPQAPSAPQPATAPPEYVFPSGAGVLFFHVRPEKVQDFEAVTARLSQVLDSTADPTRKQQAASWRVFRSAETPRESVIYLFVFDPAVLGADYDPVKILSEAAPTEVQQLYERLRADVLRVERMGLTKLR
jgi:hypothetical protein